MRPDTVKRRLWRRALRMNPQTATYIVRTLATTTGGVDSTTTYSLLRLTYDEPEANELAMAEATLEDSFQVWHIYQVDLDLAGAPRPVPKYMLTFADGTSWVIKNVKGEELNQAWRCLCQQARPK